MSSTFAFKVLTSVLTLDNLANHLEQELICQYQVY